MQGHDGVTALDGGEGLIVVARLSVCLTVPSVAVANFGIPFIIYCLADGQVQGHDGVAALGSS